MSVNDMRPMNGFDADASRYDRMNRTQQADFAPGQDAVFQQSGIFAQSSVPITDNSMSDIFNNSAGSQSDLYGAFNNPAQGNMMQPSGNSMMQQPMNQQQPMSDDEKAWEAMKKAGKGVSGFVSDVVNSVSSLTPYWWEKFGRITATIGVIVAVVGFIGKLLGLGVGFQLCVGGLISAAEGVIIWFFLDEKAKSYSSMYKDENNTAAANQMQEQPAPVEQPTFSSSFDTMSFDSNMSSSSNTDFFPSDDFSSSEEEEDPYGLGDDDEGDWGVYNDTSTVEPIEAMSTEDALASLEDIPHGMYERRYLYDMFSKKLPTMKPDFSEMRDIDMDDDIFLMWGDYLRDAAAVAGCKEDLLPELLKLEENLFTIRVTCDRPQGFKPEAVSKELANIYAYRNGTKDENVFAKYDTIGRECVITIFNGASAMISLRDMMLKEEDFILDTKNYIPVLLGVDQLGNVIKYDFKKLESIIITGMPRSGKSWFVQAVLTQMCVYVPPTELNIFICDPKEGISDFKGFTLPHVKKFVSGDNNIVDTLRQLIKKEAPRRKKIIGDAGFVNIWDYKEVYPDIKLPIIYVVIDEVVTLASRMDKETNNEFRMLLRELISQLPALGIRAFLIPHVLNNDIIEKKTSDLVPCKISVCGDADHIEKATGSKPKDFPYKLVNKGDMAVKLTGIQNTLYVHGPALTHSNPENNDLFDYLRRVWSKLEPDEINNSVAVKAQEEADNASLLAQLEDDSENIEVFTNPNDDGLSGMMDFSDL